MLFETRNTPLPGLLELQPRLARDARGLFVKPFHRETFASLGLATEFAEQFYSVSHRHVLRGMHCQLPPHDHVKLVYCTAGRVLDVVVDLRVGSPTFGRHHRVELSAQQANMLYIPSGFAHGFLSLLDESTMVYHVTTAHAPSHDSGVCWNSLGVDWPVRDPIVSARDAALTPLSEFVSPFRYTER
jgi:dTDP-4-dehydrorhamnose 3,5-epimerase